MYMYICISFSVGRISGFPRARVIILCDTIACADGIEALIVSSIIHRLEGALACNRLESGSPLEVINSREDR